MILGQLFVSKNLYEFTSSGILCTNHIDCRDQLCVNLDTGELIQKLGLDVQGGGK